jgi:hypothetical protein
MGEIDRERISAVAKLQETGIGLAPGRVAEGDRIGSAAGGRCHALLMRRVDEL